MESQPVVAVEGHAMVSICAFDVTWTWTGLGAY